MKIETTLFWNEHHYFKERIQNSLEFVDELWICECEEAHSGKFRRPFQVPNLINSLDPKFRTRVKHVPVVYPPEMAKASLEERDAFVRDGGLRYLKASSSELKFKKDDLFFCTDFDEFISPLSIETIQKSLRRFFWFRKYTHLKMRFSYFALNILICGPGRAGEWTLPFVCDLRWAQKKMISIHRIRNRKSKATTRGFTGWHHSYLGNEAFIKDKLQSFCHANDKMVVDNLGSIKEAIRERRDLFGRDLDFKTITSKEYSTIGISSLLNRSDLFV